MGVLFCLEAIRNYSPETRFYNAGSSEQFGDVIYSPQDINHPFRPRSPYGAAKCAAHHLVKVYRDSYNIYAVQGILFNHEGVRRGEEFVTRKITKGVARINSSICDEKPFEPIKLGNLSATRDWSDSEDFVEAVWLMLNKEEPKDYLLSSNETHTIREFVEKAFLAAGIEGAWIGEGLNEKFIVPNWVHDISGVKSSVLVEIDPVFFRPCEVQSLFGNSDTARKELSWNPKVSFDQLVKKMVDWDINNS
jgi:GDPmannose 4,6-dehydratase